MGGRRARERQPYGGRTFIRRATEFIEPGANQFDRAVAVLRGGLEPVAGEAAGVREGLPPPGGVRSLDPIGDLRAASDPATRIFFVTPWVIGFLIFTLGPVMASLGLSFMDYELITAPTWRGTWLLNWPWSLGPATYELTVLGRVPSLPSSTRHASGTTRPTRSSGRRSPQRRTQPTA